LNVFLQKTNVSWDWGFESCRGHAGLLFGAGGEMNVLFNYQESYNSMISTFDEFSNWLLQ